MQIFPSLLDTLKWPYPVNGERGLDVLLSPAIHLTMTRPRMQKKNKQNMTTFETTIKTTRLVQLQL